MAGTVLGDVLFVALRGLVRQTLRGDSSPRRLERLRLVLGEAGEYAVEYLAQRFHFFC
jgi:hypothetical protein